jgi:hypothetical protein
MKKRLLLTLTTLLLAVLGASAEVQGTHFTYDTSAFHAKTNLYVTFVDAQGNSVNEHTWEVGAFIGGECRASTNMLQVETTNEGITSTFYLLEVGGDDGTGTSEVGQAIQLRVYRPSEAGGPEGGFEYIIEGTNFTFQSDASVGEPSNPVKVTFDPLTGITLVDNGYITIHRNQPVDVNTYVDNLLNQALPVITWTVSEQAAQYVTLNGSNLTGTAITPEYVGVNWSCGNQSGTLYVKVDAPATNFIWNQPYYTAPLQGQLTIAVGDNTTLVEVLTNGYKLEPEDATTEFSADNWKSSNEDVISRLPTNGQWEVKAKGTTVLTGRAYDGCGLEPKLNVTVVQPVTGIRLNYSTVTAELGSDITALLNKLMGAATVFPEDADNKTLKWTVDGEYVAYENGKYIAKKLTGDAAPTILLEATDGYGYSNPFNLIINIISPLAKSVSAVKDPLGLNYAGSEINVQETIINNFKVNPDSYSVQELMRNQRLYIEIDEDNQDPAGTSIEHNVINWVNDALTVVGPGTCTIRLSGTFDSIDEWGQFQAWSTQVSASFRVNVSNGLQFFSFDDVQMTTEETATLTLEPNPAECEYDPSLISVEVLGNPDFDMPAEWKTIELTRMGKNSLQFNVKAYSLGAFSVRVLYNGEEKGEGTVAVNQRLHLKDGWQWIALQGQIEGNFEEVFGNQIAEARSETEMMINDSKLGYWGNLQYFMNEYETYKVKMNLGTDERTADINAYSYLDRMASGSESEVHAGWNWIGNPYQYYQNVNDIFAGGEFVEGDVVKTKTQFASFDGQQWQPAITVEPGQGMILYKKTEGVLSFASEFGLAQNTAKPATARSASPDLWKIDDSRFDDNMAMVAYVGALPDASQVTLWAFVGDECRGRSVTVGDRQFITIHGQQGERITFKVYDQTTGQLRQIVGSRLFTAMSGTVKEPVALYAGPVITGIEAPSSSVALPTQQTETYDLQGRRVSNATKGLYIQNGRKVVVR